MIICADDYGLNSNINMAILDLAQQNKVSAVSVLINRVTLISITDLAALSHKIKIGLHLELGNIEKQINSGFD